MWAHVIGMYVCACACTHMHTHTVLCRGEGPCWTWRRAQPAQSTKQLFSKKSPSCPLTRSDLSASGKPHKGHGFVSLEGPTEGPKLRK